LKEGAVAHVKEGAVDVTRRRHRPYHSSASSRYKGMAAFDDTQPVQLDTLQPDTVSAIAEFIPTASILTLAAVSKQTARTFEHAVLRLALSKVSLRTAALRPALQGLCRRYPGLTDLELSHSGATDADVAFIAGSFHQLTRLSLEGCDAISDASAAVLAEALPRLQELQLLGCRDVSDRGVLALVPRCTQLRSLLLGWCDISDRGLQVISRLRETLTSIDLSGCARVSDRGVRALIAHCPQLASVQLEGCRELSVRRRSRIMLARRGGLGGSARWAWWLGEVGLVARRGGLSGSAKSAHAVHASRAGLGRHGRHPPPRTSLSRRVYTGH
jgi:hypothetical protein